MPYLGRTICSSPYAKNEATAEFRGHLAADIASRKAENIALHIVLENFVILLYFGCHISESRIDSRKHFVEPVL